MKPKKLAGPTLVPWDTRPGAAVEPVPPGAYGVVRVTRGQLKGYLGLYDDDEDGLAFVYPRGPPPAEYVVCRRTSLAKATDAEAERWWNINGNQIATRITARELIGRRGDGG